MITNDPNEPAKVEPQEPEDTVPRRPNPSPFEQALTTRVEESDRADD